MPMSHPGGGDLGRNGGGHLDTHPRGQEDQRSVTSAYGDQRRVNIPHYRTGARRGNIENADLTPMGIEIDIRPGPVDAFRRCRIL